MPMPASCAASATCRGSTGTASRWVRCAHRRRCASGSRRTDRARFDNLAPRHAVCRKRAVHLACRRIVLSAAAASWWWVLGCAAAPLPPTLAASLQQSGLPLTSFGVYAEPVDGNAPEALAALNTERPFLLGSTANLVTSLAALHLPR